MRWILPPVGVIKKGFKMKFTTIFLSLILFMSSVFAADPIGKVIAVEGKVEASKRALSRGASIFVADVVVVNAASKIQIKFSDGGLLNLIEKTEYRIDSYAFKTDGKNEFGAELVKGGFRALSGSIGKENPDGFKVKTPVASMGVRGTIFEANIVRGETFFGCDSGSISVSNEAGARVLNSGEFVSSKSSDQLGDVTDVRPDALSEDLFTAAEGGESLETAESSIEAEEAAPEGEEETGEEGEIEEIELPEEEGNPPC